LLLFLGFGIYLFFSLAHLSLPGLQYDEVLFTNAALGDVDGTFVDWKIRVFHRTIPLMLMSYIGALKALIYAPIFRFIGMNALTARLPVVLLGLASLILTYALLRRMLGTRTALVTLILLAADPSFIFSVKLDWGPVALMMVLKAASLYLLWRWLEGGNKGFLLAGSFLLGLGVYDKITFTWYVVGLLIALPCCFWRELKSRMNWREMSLSMLAFAIGCSPLIVFNLTHWMQTFHGHGITIGRWGESLSYRYNLFCTTLGGGAVYDFVNHLDVGNYTALAQKGHTGGLDAFLSALAGLPLRSTLMPQLFVLSLMGLLLLWLFKRLASARAIAFFLIQFAVAVVFNYLSDEATGPHHTIMVYPIPHILIGYCLMELIRLGEARGRLIKLGLMFSSCFCLIALVISQVVIDARYVWSFQVKGGVRYWSDAIYELARYADSRPDKNYLLMDWGFNSQLLLLSRGKIHKEESYFSIKDARDDEKLDRMQSYLRLPSSLLVFHAPPFETFPLLEIFEKSARRTGLLVNQVKTFHQRDGAPVYYIYEISHSGLNSYLQKGGFFWFREAEYWDDRAGGNLDLKQGASRGKALGDFWGRQQTDFALYRFSIPRPISDVHLYIRYAFEGTPFRQYHLYLDGKLAATFALSTTGGYGYTEREWRLYDLGIGGLARGDHELKIVPASGDQVVNLDYFYICEGEFWLDSSPPPR
jgi:4-amino-4-deoxy-L-arabinose transferase-like glycosyltransferase